MKQYYMSTGFSKLVVVVGGPIALVVLIGFVSLGNLSVPVTIILSLAITIALLLFFWFGSTRGTCITIDDDNNLYNTGLFVKREAIPLSSLVSLTARHPLLMSGKVTVVWKTYRNEAGKLVTKSLVSRQALNESDFRDLIERIRKANPKINIAEELLK
jgi:hypothetical protein